MTIVDHDGLLEYNIARMREKSIGGLRMSAYSFQSEIIEAGWRHLPLARPATPVEPLWIKDLPVGGRKCLVVLCCLRGPWSLLSEGTLSTDIGI